MWCLALASVGTCMQITHPNSHRHAHIHVDKWTEKSIFKSFLDNVYWFKKLLRRGWCHSVISTLLKSPGERSHIGIARFHLELGNNHERNYCRGRGAAKKGANKCGAIPSWLNNSLGQSPHSCDNVPEAVFLPRKEVYLTHSLRGWKFKIHAECNGWWMIWQWAGIWERRGAIVWGDKATLCGKNKNLSIKTFEKELANLY